jgi:hypothetical protein
MDVDTEDAHRTLAEGAWAGSKNAETPCSVHLTQGAALMTPGGVSLTADPIKTTQLVARELITGPNKDPVYSIFQTANVGSLHITANYLLEMTSSSQPATTHKCPSHTPYCRSTITVQFCFVLVQVVTHEKFKMAVMWVVVPCSLVVFTDVSTCLLTPSSGWWWRRQQAPLKRR